MQTTDEKKQRGTAVVRNLLKTYPMYLSPVDRLKHAFGVGGGPASNFTALSDINFSISRGETIGILGLNGAGKSTLLGILAGVITPSAGTVELHGRVTALLELGAGFNPEWTGRQNVEFYGIVQGLSVADAKSQIPKIEAFADIGAHFDQPIRTYSSGMLMRVAFSAAICVDPDILIVDEALAVGDSRFQNKCFREFERFKAAGKTIVVVTHSPELVVQHCTRCLVLNNGELLIDGEPVDGMNYYLNMLYGRGQDSSSADRSGGESPGEDVSTAADPPSAATTPSLGQGEIVGSPAADENTIEWPSVADDGLPGRPGYNREEYRYGNGKGRIFDASIMIDGSESLVARSGSVMTLTLDAVFTEAVQVPFYGFVIKTKENLRVYGTTSAMQNQQVANVDTPTQVRVEITVPLQLPQGEYFMDIGLGELVDNEPVVLDARISSMSFHMGLTPWCNGIADLSAVFQEHGRRAISATSITS